MTYTGICAVRNNVKNATAAISSASISSCLKDAETVLVTTLDDAYMALRPEDILEDKESVTVMDFLSCLPGSIQDHPNIRYIPMGRNIDDAAAIRSLEGLWRGGKH